MACSKFALARGRPFAPFGDPFSLHLLLPKKGRPQQKVRTCVSFRLIGGLDWFGGSKSHDSRPSARLSRSTSALKRFKTKSCELHMPTPAVLGKPGAPSTSPQPSRQNGTASEVSGAPPSPHSVLGWESRQAETCRLSRPILLGEPAGPRHFMGQRHCRSKAVSNRLAWDRLVVSNMTSPTNPKPRDA